MMRMLGSNDSLYRASWLVLACAACLPAADSGSDRAAAERTASESVPSGEANIGTVVPRFLRYQSQGDLCPSDAATWSIQQDGSFRLTVLPLIADTGPRQHGCTLGLALEVPAGYRFRDAAIHFRTQTSGRVTLTSRASFLEGGQWGPTHRVLPQDWSAYREELAGAWSPTCEDRSRAQLLNLQIEVDADLAFEAFMELEIVGDFGFAGGAEWTRCTDSPSIPAAAAGGGAPPPAARLAEGATCASDAECAAHLTCLNATCRMLSVRSTPDAGTTSACRGDDDCASNEICLDGACLSLGPACDADGDCERGLWCIRGICLDPEAGPSI